MVWLKRALVVVIALQMTPGLGELAENLVHLAAHGDSAHALADTDHPPADSEHGCSGPFHLCFCHTSISIFVSAPTRLAHCLIRDAGMGPTVDQRAADGYLTAIFRPPIG